MFDSVKKRLAGRQVQKAMSARDAATWQNDPKKRRVMIILPSDDISAHAAWHFIENIDIPVAELVVVRLTPKIVYTPTSFVGHLHIVDEDERSWTELPAQKFIDSIWGRKPDIAIDLHLEPNQSSRFLVGASPAKFRIGFYQEEAEPFYDFMLVPKEDPEMAMQALQRYLEEVVPAILPFRRSAKEIMKEAEWRRSTKFHRFLG